MPQRPVSSGAPASAGFERELDNRARQIAANEHSTYAAPYCTALPRDLQLYVSYIERHEANLPVGAGRNR